VKNQFSATYAILVHIWAVKKLTSVKFCLFSTVTALHQQHRKSYQTP